MIALVPILKEMMTFTYITHFMWNIALYCIHFTHITNGMHTKIHLVVNPRQYSWEL